MRPVDRSMGHNSNEDFKLFSRPRISRRIEGVKEAESYHFAAGSGVGRVQ